MVNKKGHEAIRTLIYGIFVFVVMLVGILIIFWIIANLNFDTKMQATTLQYNILSNRYVSSPSCFAYVDDRGEDPSGHVHIGVIDSNKFTTDRITDCVDGVGAKASLNFRSEDEKPSILKKTWEGIDNVGDTFFVRYREGDEEYPAYLTMQLSGYMVDPEVQEYDFDDGE